MSIYTSVAAGNPAYARGVIAKYGYQAQGARSANDLAALLKQLVAREGEPALRDIAEGHPDRGLFLELYGQPKVEKYLNASGDESCKCHKCGCGRDREFHNFAGADAAPVAIQAASQGTALMAAALILAVAILVKR